MDEVVLRQPGVPPCGAGAVVALAHLADGGRAADVGDPAVAAVDEVLRGQPAAEVVVDGTEQKEPVSVARSTTTTGVPCWAMRASSGEPGSIGVILRSISGGLADLRDLVARTHDLRRHEPSRRTWKDAES